MTLYRPWSDQSMSPLHFTFVNAVATILFLVSLDDMMEEDDDENGEEAQQYDAEGNPVDEDMVEFHDDSVQGFFTHKGKTPPPHYVFSTRPYCPVLAWQLRVVLTTDFHCLFSHDQ